ncbi:MAG: UxaA family hydrolase [Phycisphaeraceae bacterium]
MNEAASAFVVHSGDNVATLLCDVAVGERVELRGAGTMHEVVAGEAIALGHKLAVADIAANEPVTKFGVPIGKATQPIAAGQWVHLHNCASELDTRSGTLDVHTGETTDTRYE